MARKQGYNDRMDESLGMRRGPEKDYSQSYKDRRDESRGMKKKSYAGSIESDYSAPANLPQDVRYESYPPCDYLRYGLDDSYRMIDENVRSSVRKLSKAKPDSKY